MCGGQRVCRWMSFTTSTSPFKAHVMPSTGTISGVKISAFLTDIHCMTVGEDQLAVKIKII